MKQDSSKCKWHIFGSFGKFSLLMFWIHLHFRLPSFGIQKKLTSLSVLFKSIIITSNNNTLRHFYINRLKLSLKTHWRFTTIICWSFFFLHKSLFLLGALVMSWILNLLKCTTKQCLFKSVLKLFFKIKRTFLEQLKFADFILLLKYDFFPNHSFNYHTVYILPMIIYARHQRRIYKLQYGNHELIKNLDFNYHRHIIECLCKNELYYQKCIICIITMQKSLNNQ